MKTIKNVTASFIEAKVEIEKIYVAHGSPARYDGCDTTTETSGYYFATADSEDMVEIVDRYNCELEMIAAMIDKRHIGGGIWYTSYYPNAEFIAFADEAANVIDDFIENYDWE